MADAILDFGNNKILVADRVCRDETPCQLSLKLVTPLRT